MVLNFQGVIEDSWTSESADPEGEFVLAGHIAEPGEWAKLIGEWDRLLPKFGTRAKNGKWHFKMKEMAQFPDRMERVPIFYKLIEDNVITSISCRMNLGDFRRARERLARQTATWGWSVMLRDWDKPHFVTFRGLMDGFHDKREMFADRLPLDRKVDFIFDKEIAEKQVIKIWDEYLEGRPDEVRSYYGERPRFLDDQEFLALQSADLWAWWVRTWYEWDASDFPDKLRDFDFGTWKGKKRTNIVISLDEDRIFEALQKQFVSNCAEGNVVTQADRVRDFET
jgi:hypothetical protein